jgi:beta-lactamase regulating signal transducer with metallopeptidase domain
MSELISWLNSWGNAFVPFAIRMLIQSSVLILILLLLDLFLRRRVRAVVRYWIWLLVLAKLLLPPSLSSPTSLVSWIGGRLPEKAIVSVVPPSSSAVHEAVSATAPMPAEATSSSVGANDYSPLQTAGQIPAPSETSTAPAQPVVLLTWQALVLLAWMAAVVIMVVLLIQRAFFVRALLAQSQEATDVLNALLEQCRRHMGVRNVAGVRLTSLSASPSVCGLFRPVILVPEPMARQLEMPQLRSVLLHELAHIKRGDLWINLLQTLLQIVYLYHPLLWWANARIRAIREQAVDEAVLAALGEEAEQYPRTLLSISKLAFGTPSFSLRLLGVVESKRALTARIRHMVSRPFPKNARLGLLGLAAVAVIAAVLLPMARGTETRRSETSQSRDRLQTEGDSELAQLIRTAVANHKGASEQEIQENTRRVTDGRAQILLLDRQIEEVTHKIESTPGSEEARRPLLQTRKKLEAKRMAEMADLREAIGIVPRLALGKQPTANLNAWVKLQVLEQQVVVLDTLKEFTDYWASARHKVVGALSEKETLDYLKGRLRDKRNLPIRISISYEPETKGAAEDLHQKILAAVREANADMDTEVPLELATWVGSGAAPFFLREGKITTLYPDPVQRPDGGPRLLDSGVLDPDDLEQHILWRLTMPRNLPLTFRIEYDEASGKLATQVADTIKAVAMRAGLADVVNVVAALVEPVPETAFLGRWQAITQGEMQTLDIQPGGICEVTMGSGTEAIKAGAKVRGAWFVTTRGVFVDIHDNIGGARYLYQGCVNGDGNLVVNRGRVFPRGVFVLRGPSVSVFQKVK